MYYKHVFFVMYCFVNVAQAFGPVELEKTPLNEIVAPRKLGATSPASSTDSYAETIAPVSSKSVATTLYYLTPCGSSQVFSGDDLLKKTANVP